jgi:hypothetical protein
MMPSAGGAKISIETTQRVDFPETDLSATGDAIVSSVTGVCARELTDRCARDPAVACRSGLP